jgi:hypothetical protein
MDNSSLAITEMAGRTRQNKTTAMESPPNDALQIQTNGGISNINK